MIECLNHACAKNSFPLLITQLTGKFVDHSHTNEALRTLQLLIYLRAQGRSERKLGAWWRPKWRALRSAPTPISRRFSRRWSKGRPWCGSTGGKGVGQRSTSIASKPTPWRYCSSSWRPGGHLRHLETQTNRVSRDKNRWSLLFLAKIKFCCKF